MYVATDDLLLHYFQLDTERRTSENLQSLLSSERKKVRLSTKLLYSDRTVPEMAGSLSLSQPTQQSSTSLFPQEFQTHMTGQERETEIQHLRRQLSRLEADR